MLKYFGSKIEKFWNFGLFQKILFFTTKIFFSKKNFWSWKIGFWEKAKISKFFNFWPKIFQQQQMLKTLNFFSELQIYSKTCKKILGPILNKNTSQKNSWGGKGLSPPQRVNVRFKRDWHKKFFFVKHEEKDQNLIWSESISRWDIILRGYGTQFHLHIKQKGTNLKFRVSCFQENYHDYVVDIIAILESFSHSKKKGIGYDRVQAKKPFFIFFLFSF